MATIIKGLAVLAVLFVGVILLKHLTKSNQPSPSPVDIGGFLQQKGKIIIYIALLIMLLLMLIQIKEWDMSGNDNAKLEQVITIEKLTNLDRENGFCKSNDSNAAVLEKKCNQLSKKNCNVVNCCVYLNDDKCVAGDSNGPTFITDDKGKNIDIDTYYFRNKCYGKGC
jgi:hypothetical protein